MTQHQKRLSAPDSWPIERKTETFTVKAGAGPHGEAGVPLVIILRDVLGYADSTKEARYALNQRSVLVNGDVVSDEQRPVGLFDILAFTEREEYYRVFPESGGRLALTPINESDANSRLGKIINKQQVSGGAVQLTLHDGANLRVDADEIDTYNQRDSLVIDNETKEIVAHFPYEEGSLVTAVGGTHSGEIGEIETITVTAGSSENTVSVSTGEEYFETIEPYVVVIDENFTDDEDMAATDDVDDTDADADADADADTDTDTDADDGDDTQEGDE